MSNKEDLALISHLMRRAGFGVTYDEAERLADQGYEETVEQLLNPETQPALDEVAMYRYHPTTEFPAQHYAGGQANWLYHLINTKRPLQEKIALFWHHVFATGNGKVDNCDNMIVHLEMLRDNGMGNYRELLSKLASNPAMIYWLDNNENHKNAPNENWGRELLELFTLGVGNYTEKDVFECSRAFTGWTIGAKMPRFPYGRFPWSFEYRAEDHDGTEKTFLGHTGNFNGEDILDIILQQPACPAFISRHLYNFFVADEPQVPSWDIEAPRDPEAVKLLSDTFVDNSFEITPVLRTLFNSDFFKESMHQKVKSPIEVVVGTLKLTQDMQGPDPRLESMANEAGYMGQEILDPPSVEGWHTGYEWVNSGSLVKRINFVADRVGDTELPGVRRIVEKIATANGPSMSPAEFVDQCLHQMGQLPVADNTRLELINHAANEGSISWQDADHDESSRRTGEMLSLIGATREYQFG